MNCVHLLSGGAAQGLVNALAARFEAQTKARVEGRFGAVGAMKEALLGGAACDVMIATRAMVDALCAEGRLQAESRADIGRVRTGVAVRCGAAPPDVSTPEALSAALLDADAIYFPDPERATAGIHFAKVMQELGIAERLRPRWRVFPNGATAMGELARATSARPIGCTQVSEILSTEGVDLVAPLPPRFELATVYTAALTTACAQPELARQWVALLTGPDSAHSRASAGFEP